MSKGKGFIVLLFAFVLLSSAAFALPNVEYIKINGDKYESGDNLEVEKGDELEFRVKLSADQDEEDIELRAYFAGYEYGDHVSLSDSTHVFDLEANTTSYKDLEIRLPDNMDVDKDYDVKMTIDASEGSPDTYVFPISLQAARHSLSIEDVIFSPENEIMAGRAMLATVRVENNGDRDEESIKVSVRIPALGVSASDYIDELEEGDEITSEELYLRIPSCVEGGVYTAEIEVTYDDGYETVGKDTTIRVVEDETCYEAPSDDEEEQPEKTIISVGSTDMDVVKGEGGVVYPITVTNSGSKSKTYTIGVEGATGWGSVKITPSNTVVLAPGETKAVYVYLSATEAASAGERMFSISISSDQKVLKQIPMTANIADGEPAQEGSAGWDQVKRGLEVGLIVLVVLLVLLGLIVGFNKLKGDKEDDDQTYY